MTLYRRLKFFYLKKPIPLTPEQRLELGRIVKEQFLLVKAENEMYCKVTIVEDNQTFLVNSYPKMYSPLIDDCIKEYDLKTFPPEPAKRVRKRIPIKRDAN